MKSIMNICLLLCILLSSIAHAQLSIDQFPSGKYDESSTLAVNTEEKNISGYVYANRGDVNDSGKSGFECEFYFSGKIRSNEPTKVIAISLKDKKSIVGTITLDPDNNAALLIKLNDAFKGCAMFGNNYELNIMSKKMNWLEQRLVLAKRSHFYNSEETIKHRKAYVVCGDIVTVTSKDKSSGRVKVEYGKTTGWLQEKDLLEIGEELKCP